MAEPLGQDWDSLITQARANDRYALRVAVVSCLAIIASGVGTALAEGLAAAVVVAACIVAIVVTAACTPRQ